MSDPGRKAMINLDSVLKSRDFTLLTKVHIYSQSYGFSSSHLWMWELDHKKGLALKNWETLERPLDFKIKPVNPKGNQPWLFIGRTDAEAEAPILWSPDAKNWLTGKDPDAGKDWRQQEKGQQRVGWLNSISDSMDMNLSKLWEIVKDREAMQSRDSQRVGHDLSIGQQ